MLILEMPCSGIQQAIPFYQTFVSLQLIFKGISFQKLAPPLSLRLTSTRPQILTKDLQTHHQDQVLERGLHQSHFPVQNEYRYLLHHRCLNFVRLPLDLITRFHQPTPRPPLLHVPQILQQMASLIVQTQGSLKLLATQRPIPLKPPLLYHRLAVRLALQHQPLAQIQAGILRRAQFLIVPLSFMLPLLLLRQLLTFLNVFLKKLYQLVFLAFQVWLRCRSELLAQGFRLLTFQTWQIYEPWMLLLLVFLLQESFLLQISYLSWYQVIVLLVLRLSHLQVPLALLHVLHVLLQCQLRQNLPIQPGITKQIRQ